MKKKKKKVFHLKLAVVFANVLKHCYAYVPDKSADVENLSPFEVVQYCARKGQQMVTFFLEFFNFSSVFDPRKVDLVYNYKILHCCISMSFVFLAKRLLALTCLSKKFVGIPHGQESA